VRAIRGRVARPLIDLEEPELAVSGTEGQVATTGGLHSIALKDDGWLVNHVKGQSHQAQLTER